MSGCRRLEEVPKRKTKNLLIPKRRRIYLRGWTRSIQIITWTGLCLSSNFTGSADFEEMLTQARIVLEMTLPSNSLTVRISILPGSRSVFKLWLRTRDSIWSFCFGMIRKLAPSIIGQYHPTNTSYKSGHKIETVPIFPSIHLQLWAESWFNTIVWGHVLVTCHSHVGVPWCARFACTAKRTNHTIACAQEKKWSIAIINPSMNGWWQLRMMGFRMPCKGTQYYSCSFAN